MTTLGDRLKSLRKRFKFTQAEMAEKLGMGRANYSHIENNRVTPSSADLEKIADILKTNTDYLLCRTEDSSIKTSETPSSIKAWLRAGNPDLTEEEKEDLASELEDYFQLRKQRILKERDRKGE
ncbi:helix-turn-helix transcriptional regulator [Brevibacillus parabrevis]|uniref:helix-turn-helix domain-containing protein n=1 Tax=Brevibacillus TaxID=55080 RepID=UPI00257D5A0E|nr:helix-turn-helix transcriptional regulator [Brevibacillus sp.]